MKSKKFLNNTLLRYNRELLVINSKSEPYKLLDLFTGKEKVIMIFRCNIRRRVK